jgi:S-methylmethionine-dependent homocysteine/selenocysteine methylase
MVPPQPASPYLTDGGLETSLIFRQGIDLPSFAAFPLLETEEGAAALGAYFEPYLALARQHGTGFVLDTATWRANRDWGAELGYSPAQLDAANRRAVAFAQRLRDETRGETPIVIDGVVGPRGDGYVAGERMTAGEAERYHAPQIASFAAAGADVVSAVTMTYAEEAVGIARAARGAGLPVVVSFTVETDGRLPSGQSLRAAVEQVEAETERAPAHYMINCAHPTHFADALEPGEWLDRIGGLRANASMLSHAELDAAEELDAGDPVQLGAEYAGLRSRLRGVTVLGGCCGTDHRHVAAVAAAWQAAGAS